VIQNVELSMQDPTTPARARSTGTNDWLVGFLVEESSQSNFVTGLNDPTVGAFGFGGAWKPSNCAGYVDTDVNDQVLHALDYSLWSANPGANPPQNTGIPGTDRVLCTNTVVGTLVLEVDDGGCDLNADGDTADEILRWVTFTSAQLPFGTASQLNAVTTATPGGTFGISDLSNKFICVVSELDDNTDHDLDGLKTHNLVAWLNPTVGSPTWTFDHNSAAAVSYVGASWMMDRAQRDRLLVAYQESVANHSINTGGDNDKLDSVPTFSRFDPNNSNDLDFPGPAVAISANNAGLMIVNGYGLYRVDEAADNRDWNGDGDKNDFVIFRTDLSSNFSAYIGVANSLSTPVAFNTGTVGAAFQAQESMNAQDFNGDGRTDGFIVSYFRVN
jgi:hypothetical protein